MSGIEHVLTATAEAAREFGETVLAVDVAVHDASLGVPQSSSALKHVSIALVGDTVALQMGICAPEVSCSALSRALLGVETGEDIPPEDIIDGIGEVANIIGGGIKSRLDSIYPSLQLGLPVWNRYFPEPCHRSTDVACIPVSIGSHEVTLTIMKEVRES